MKEFLTPAQMLKAFVTPFVCVLGGASLLLWLLFLPLPVDSLQIVGQFLHESITALFPVVRTLASVWLTYTIIYLALSCLNSRFSVSRLVYEVPEKIGEFAPYAIYKASRSWTIPALTEKLLNLLRAGIPTQPATKWHPSAFPQLK